ncbi:MAG TPA: peptide chain release factor 3 [Dongiaceae bacterium]|jgi:peptide chain release factor 3|nr:peptide chain release factor 3 [Dongiaceae bacterium]
MTLAQEIAARRTFAIIAHPDAGKTTLTEKLLFLGGAIQLAGAVKARGEQRRARSDWLAVERERGISVTASVMTFSYGDCTFNLLDTPGHEDFSEDTYRTLTAVDSAIMVIDAAKGIESQTRKLFEACRLRDVPIITFINKMDREALDPFALLDDIAGTLALDVSPASWPIGMGKQFQGCFDLIHNRLALMERGGKTQFTEISGLDKDALASAIGPRPAEQLCEEIALARAALPPFSLSSYREGHLSPVFFGSAINNFGVQELLEGIRTMAPSPRPQKALSRFVHPEEKAATGFIFKIQANMDPKHRDRIAFLRLCSGRLRRGMKMRHVRAGREIVLHNPVLFLAQDRQLAESACAGDIVGIPNHGNLRIGDTLTEGEELSFLGLPAFAPEYLQAARAGDPLRAKHLGKALTQLAEEGAARVFKPELGTDWIVGVVGALQFEVLAARIRAEYDLPVRFEPASLHTARWIEADDPVAIKRFEDANRASLAFDHNREPVFLARNAWHLDKAAQDYPDLRFLKVKEH